MADTVGGIQRLVNSKAGLLVLGFVLTTGVGTFLTDRIQRGAREHEVRYEQLHEDRGRAIKDLHTRMVELERDLFNLNYKYRPVGLAPEQVDEFAVLESVRSLRVELQKARIYFSEAMAEELSALGSTFEEAFTVLEGEILNPSEPGGVPQFEAVPFLPLIDEIRAARLDVEAEFRRLIGVS